MAREFRYGPAEAAEAAGSEGVTNVDATWATEDIEEGTVMLTEAPLAAAEEVQRSREHHLCCARCQVCVSLCLSHRVSHCLSLTVSLSPSLPLCLSHRVSHCVSLYVSPTVSLSPCLLLSLSHRVSLTCSLTV